MLRRYAGRPRVNALVVNKLHDDFFCLGFQGVSYYPDAHGPSYGGVGPESFRGVWGLKSGFQGPDGLFGVSG